MSIKHFLAPVVCSMLLVMTAEAQKNPPSHTVTLDPTIDPNKISGFPYLSLR